MRLKSTAVVFASPEGREEFRARSVEIIRDLADGSAVTLRFFNAEKTISIRLPFCESTKLLMSCYGYRIAPEDAESWERRHSPASLPSVLALVLRLQDTTATLPTTNGDQTIAIHEAEFTRNLRRHTDRLDFLIHAKPVVSIRFPFADSSQFLFRTYHQLIDRALWQSDPKELAA